MPPRPVRILVAGDSTAEATGNGLIAWAAANPQLAQVSLVVQEGCGFVPGGYTQAIGIVDRDVDKNCHHYLADVLPANGPQAAPRRRGDDDHVVGRATTASCTASPTRSCRSPIRR